MQVTHAVHKYYCGIYTYKYIHTNSNHEKKRILEQIWFNCDSENLLQASLVFFTVLVWAKCWIFVELFLQTQKLGLKPDMASYNILLKACCVAGRVDLAQDMYRELKHLESVGELKLDVFTYSTIIKVYYGKSVELP